MRVITERDFETKAGQKKIVAAIHTLEHKVRELDQMVHELMHKESVMEQDLQGYNTHPE